MDDRINNELQELIELLKSSADDEVRAVYCKVRDMVVCDVIESDLAVSRVLRDIQEERRRNPKYAMLLEEVLVNLLCSYRQLGQNVGLSCKGVYVALKRLSKRYWWVKGIMEGKSKLFSKGGGRGS